MNVNLQQFTRTWPSGTAVTEEVWDKEVEEEDELGGKINYNCWGSISSARKRPRRRTQGS